MIRSSTLARIQALTESRDRVSLREPARPTWYGDRMQATADRVEAAYGLDLAALWSPLSAWSCIRFSSGSPTGTAQRNGDGGRAVPD
ncbi:hypothetical protein [Streptomyces triculaminicus]|uniref:hypothetical protein n=1 Tax=Streptomyces triculaminicus TaxID=2816232 RepID=UPI0037D0C80D